MKITTKSAFQLVADALQESMTARGFRLVKTQEAFIAKGKEFDQRIGVMVGRWPGADHVHLNASFQVEFHAISKLLETDGPKRSKPGAVQNLYNLADKTLDLDRLDIYCEEDCQPVAQYLNENIEEYGIPFLEEFSNLDRLESVLLKNAHQAKQPFNSSTRRYEFLLACSVLRGDATRFSRIAAEATEYFKASGGGHALESFQNTVDRLQTMFE